MQKNAEIKELNIEKAPPKRQVFNPYLPLHEYIPDGEPHVFGDRVYIFGSHDKEGGTTYCELDYVVYSAPVSDLTDWKCEGTIYSARQDPHYCEERQQLYAPDVVQGNDGRFYLYYALAGKAGKGGFDGPISVAVCDTPAGKYEYYGDVQYSDGRLFRRFIPFDPAVINDNGQIRLYYGWSLPMTAGNGCLGRKINEKIQENMFHKTSEELHKEPLGVMGANTVELMEDMLTVKEEPIRILPGIDHSKGTEFEGHAFFEASSIRKVNGLYYFIYSSQLNHELCYAVSQYPDKDFHYGGVIVSNGDIGIDRRKERQRLTATGNNHGSIEYINGNWYIFYHRQTHLNSYNRQGCAERIEITEDGSITQVCMTSCGLNGEALLPEGSYPASIACVLTDGHMPHTANGISKRKHPMITHDCDERYITGIRNNVLIGFRYFAFVKPVKLVLSIRGTGKGKFIISTGTKKKRVFLEVEPEREWTEYETIIYANTTAPLYLQYKGSGTKELLKIELKNVSVV